MARERLEGKKSSRVKYEMPVKEFRLIKGDFNEKTNWDTWIEWYRPSMKKFYERMYPIWEKVQNELS